MKRRIVRCSLCACFVQLTKTGAMPDHPREDASGRIRGRCNGIRRGLRIALAAEAAELWPGPFHSERAARIRRLRYHRDGKARANDPFVQRMRAHAAAQPHGRYLSPYKFWQRY